jgi:hypothetical protein
MSKSTYRACISEPSNALTRSLNVDVSGMLLSLVYSGVELRVYHRTDSILSLLATQLDLSDKIERRLYGIN